MLLSFNNNPRIQGFNAILSPQRSINLDIVQRLVHYETSTGRPRKVEKKSSEFH